MMILKENWTLTDQMKVKKDQTKKRESGSTMESMVTSCPKRISNTTTRRKPQEKDKMQKRLSKSMELSIMMKNNKLMVR